MSRRALGSAIAIGLLSTTFLSTPAQASIEDDCAVFLQPVAVEEDGAILTTPIDLGCYATYAEALAAGSSGAIAVPDSMTPTALTDATLSADTDLALTADVLIGTEFDGTNYAGTSKSYFAVATCSTGVVWDLADLSTWDDRFGSGKGFGGCDTNKKFQNPNFGGTVVTCTPNCTTYGSLVNEVSSLRWKP
jgi:hypothetical protein